MTSTKRRNEWRPSSVQQWSVSPLGGPIVSCWACFHSSGVSPRGHNGHATSTKTLKKGAADGACADPPAAGSVLRLR